MTSPSSLPAQFQGHSITQQGPYRAAAAPAPAPAPAPKKTTAALASSAMASQSICARVSQWLWPTKWVTCDSASTRPPQPYHHHPRRHRDPLGCKACREHKVDCDHARPQCAHCYQEQLLCFYVNSNAKPAKPRPNRKANHTTGVPQLATPPPTSSRQAQVQGAAA